MSKKNINNIKGVTLVALVVTIIILLILAGVTINIVSNGGIIGKAKDAVRLTKLAEIKEQIKIEILGAQMDKAVSGEELSDEKIKEIVDKYGELQEDGDTIKTDNGDLSLKDILEENESGGDGSGGTTDEEKDQKIAELENTVGELQNTIDDLNKQLEDEKNKKTDLENRITDLNGQVEDLKKEVEDGKKTIEEQQRQIDNLNTEIASKNEELENKTNTISQLEETIRTLREQIEKLNLQVADLKAKQATGNAETAHVLTGKTFSNSSGVGLTGTMANLGALNYSNTSGTVKINPGYTTGGTINFDNAFNAGKNGLEDRYYYEGYSSVPTANGRTTFLRYATTGATNEVPLYYLSVPLEKLPDGAIVISIRYTFDATDANSNVKRSYMGYVSDTSFIYYPIESNSANPTSCYKYKYPQAVESISKNTELKVPCNTTELQSGETNLNARFDICYYIPSDTSN